MSEPEKSPDDTAQLPPWLHATLADVSGVDFEEPIATSTAATCHQLSELFRAAQQPTDGVISPTSSGACRVFTLLSSVTGMRFKPEHKNEPFGPMLTLADGRRSAAPEDFRGPHLDVLSYMAERASNPVLRARLAICAGCWTLRDTRLGALQWVPIPK